MRQPPALKSQPRERLIACTGPSRGWRINFAAKPVIAPPQAPRETIQVKAISADRDACEIRFPRVEGYRVELPEERLSAEFNDGVLKIHLPKADEIQPRQIPVNEGAD